MRKFAIPALCVVAALLGIQLSASAQVIPTSTTSDNGVNRINFESMGTNGQSRRAAISLGSISHNVTFSVTPGISGITVTVAASSGGLNGTFVTAATSTALGATISWNGTYNAVDVAVSGITGSGSVEATYYGTPAPLTLLYGLDTNTPRPITVDSTGDLMLGTGSATIGALTANQSVNVAQVNGTTTTMGIGVTGTGVQRVVLASDDPCQASGIAKTSVVLNVGDTDAEVLALSGTTIIYVCGWTATVGGTAPTYKFVYGTGSVCAGAPADLTGTFLPTIGSFNTYSPGMTAFATVAGQAICLVTGGTAPSVQGVLTYVRR